VWEKPGSKALAHSASKAPKSCPTEPHGASSYPSEDLMTTQLWLQVSRPASPSSGRPLPEQVFIALQLQPLLLTAPQNHRPQQVAHLDVQHI
jgi:hypothetical protein